MDHRFHCRFRALAEERSFEVSTRSRKTFQQLVTLPDAAVPLAEAALLMACEEYPQLEISPYLDVLDRIADSAQRALRPSDSPLEIVAKINTVLFDTYGFRGNNEHYYDPRNSFFNDVLDRRIGIPITLSAVYIEVSRRLNLPIAGVGMPGHFIVKYSNRREEFFLDPYNRGEILTREDCRQRLYERYGDAVEFSDRLLARATNRQILLRMLNNLKDIYLKSRAIDKCLSMVDMMLMIDSEDLIQFRDRGLLRLQLRQFAAAGRDLEHYLQHSPNAEDRPEIENHIKELKRIRAMMN
jgi:regulator of sirC expression with transglutaminase-like and TPR domain